MSSWCRVHSAVLFLRGSKRLARWFTRQGQCTCPTDPVSFSDSFGLASVRPPHRVCRVRRFMLVDELRLVLYISEVSDLTRAG